MQEVIKDKHGLEMPTAETVTLSAEEAALARDLLTRLLTVSPPEATGLPASERGLSDVERARLVAQAVYQSRKRRAEHFGPALFSEPAWDMLLVLYLYGEHRQQRTSVTRLAEFSELPLTTAIRWLDYLESQRMIMRSQCPNDRRKYFVSLSERGAQMMTDYFCSLIDSGMIKL